MLGGVTYDMVWLRVSLQDLPHASGRMRWVADDGVAPFGEGDHG